MQKGEPVRCKMRAHSCVLFVTGAWSGLEATDATRQTSASARRVGWGACDRAGGSDTGCCWVLCSIRARPSQRPGEAGML